MPFVILFIAVTLAHAQSDNKYTVLNQFIHAPFSSIDTELFYAKDSLLSDQLNTDVYWDKLELRYDVNRLDGETQQFEIRMQPTNIWRNSHANDLLKERQNYFKLKRLSYDIKLIEKRYQHLINYLELKSKETKNRELLILERSRLDYLTTLITSAEFNPLELLQSQEQLFKEQNDSLDLEQKRLRWHAKTKELLIGTAIQNESNNQSEVFIPNIKIEDVLSIDTIIQQVKSIDVDQNKVSVQLANSRLNAELKQNEIEIIKSNEFFSHIKLGYEYDKPKRPQDPISYESKQWFAGIGIEIPFGNGSYQKRIQQRLNVAERKTDLIDQKMKAREIIESELIEINAEHAKAKQMKRFLTQMNNGELAKAIEQWSQENPLLAMEQKQINIMRNYDFNQIKISMLRKYISLLSDNKILLTQAFLLCEIPNELK